MFHYPHIVDYRCTLLQPLSKSFFFLIFWHAKIPPSFRMPRFWYSSLIVFLGALRFSNLICLTKKAILIRLKIKTICLTRNLFWIVIKITVFIINSAKSITNSVHCFGYIFYHQSKTKKSCWFHKFLSYDLYFESYSLNVSSISYSTKYIYVHYDLLLLKHFCLCPLPFYAQFNHVLNTNTSLDSIWQLLQSQHRLFYLPFYQPLICLNYHNILI